MTIGNIIRTMVWTISPMIPATKCLKTCQDCIKRLIAASDGAAAIDFALVAVPFLALIFATIQILLIYFAQQVLETVADESSRQILTGNAQSLTQTQFAATVCGTIPGLLQCNNIMTDVQVATSFSAANLNLPALTYNGSGQVTNSWQYSPGTQGQIVVMRLMYQWPTINFFFNFSTQGNGTRLLMATRVFRNENF